MPITINGNGAISGLGDIDGHDLETATLVVSGDTTIAPQAVGRATLFVDDSANRVGINTTTPARLFQASDDTNPIISVINTATSAEGVLNAPADGTVNVGSATNDTLTLSTNSTAKVTVLANGRVGIGDTTPDRRLSVNSSDGLLARFIGPTNNLFIANDRSGLIDLWCSGSGDHLTLGTQSAEVLRVTAQKRIGINVTNPTRALEVFNNSTDVSVYFKRTLLGSTDQYQTVQSISAEDNGRVTGAGFGPAISFEHRDSVTAYAGSLISSEREVDGNRSSLVFYSRRYGYREGFRITPDQALKLGSGSPGIDFSEISSTGTNTVTSNTLDDYEEGSWTPTFAFGTWTYTIQQGIYTIVGNVCTASFLIAWGAKSGTGQMEINLPFTTGGGVSDRFCVSYGYVQGVDTDGDKQLIGTANGNGLPRFAMYYLNDNNAPSISLLQNASATGQIQASITYQIA